MPFSGSTFVHFLGVFLVVTAKNGLDAPGHDSCGETPGVACKHLFFPEGGLRADRYKWKYHPQKWVYKLVTGVISPYLLGL